MQCIIWEVRDQVHRGELPAVRWGQQFRFFREEVLAVLLNRPAVREAYASLKRELARRYRDDRIAYTEGKTGFILDSLEKASIWATETGWKLLPQQRSE